MAEKDLSVALDSGLQTPESVSAACQLVIRGVENGDASRVLAVLVESLARGPRATLHDNGTPAAAAQIHASSCAALLDAWVAAGGVNRAFDCASSSAESVVSDVNGRDEWIDMLHLLRTLPDRLGNALQGRLPTTFIPTTYFGLLARAATRHLVRDVGGGDGVAAAAVTSTAAMARAPSARLITTIAEAGHLTAVVEALLSLALHAMSLGASAAAAEDEHASATGGVTWQLPASPPRAATVLSAVVRVVMTALHGVSRDGAALQLLVMQGLLGISRRRGSARSAAALLGVAHLCVYDSEDARGEQRPATAPIAARLAAVLFVVLGDPGTLPTSLSAALSRDLPTRVPAAPSVVATALLAYLSLPKSPVDALWRVRQKPAAVPGAEATAARSDAVADASVDQALVPVAAALPWSVFASRVPLFSWVEAWSRPAYASGTDGATQATLARFIVAGMDAAPGDAFGLASPLVMAVFAGVQLRMDSPAAAIRSIALRVVRAMSRRTAVAAAATERSRGTSGQSQSGDAETFAPPLTEIELSDEDVRDPYDVVVDDIDDIDDDGSDSGAAHGRANSDVGKRALTAAAPQPLMTAITSTAANGTTSSTTRTAVIAIDVTAFMDGAAGPASFIRAAQGGHVSPLPAPAAITTAPSMSLLRRPAQRDVPPAIAAARVLARKAPASLLDAVTALRDDDSADDFEVAIAVWTTLPLLIRRAGQLAGGAGMGSLLQTTPTLLSRALSADNRFNMPGFDTWRFATLVSLAVVVGPLAVHNLLRQAWSAEQSEGTRLEIIDVLVAAAREMSGAVAPHVPLPPWHDALTAWERGDDEATAAALNTPPSGSGDTRGKAASGGSSPPKRAPTTSATASAATPNLFGEVCAELYFYPLLRGIVVGHPTRQPQPRGAVDIDLALGRGVDAAHMPADVAASLSEGGGLQLGSGVGQLLRDAQLAAAELQARGDDDNTVQSGMMLSGRLSLLAHCIRALAVFLETAGSDLTVPRMAASLLTLVWPLRRHPHIDIRRASLVACASVIAAIFRHNLAGAPSALAASGMLDDDDTIGVPLAAALPHHTGLHRTAAPTRRGPLIAVLSTSDDASDDGSDGDDDRTEHADARSSSALQPGAMTTTMRRERSTAWALQQQQTALPLRFCWIHRRACCSGTHWDVAPRVQIQTPRLPPTRAHHS